MLRLLADENFNGAIVRSLFLRKTEIDIVRVQDLDISGADDPTVLDWAALHGRVLLSHDLKTIPGFAYQRVSDGLPMPGVFMCDSQAAPGEIAGDLLLLVECSLDGEWEGQVRYLPL